MNDRLRNARKRKLLTQAQLAKKAGVAISVISYAEREEKHSVSVKTLKKLAKALDTDVSSII